MTSTDSHSPQYFGTDGIRGTVGEFPLTPDYILKIGYATGTILSRYNQKPTIIIGRDTRQSGQMLQSAFIAGLLYADVKVLDVGEIPTPGISFLTRKNGADTGAVVSASHNPVQQNGIKLFNFQGFKLTEELEWEIEQTAAEINFNQLHNPSIGRILDGSTLRKAYVDDLLQSVEGLLLDGVTLVQDCANGSASSYAAECFTRLGATIVSLHSSPNGININRSAGSEYVRRYPQEIIAHINQSKAKFAMAFDGDADRVVFIDEMGNLIDGDHTLALLSQFFKRNDHLAGNTVVATNMRNAGLVHFLEKKGIGFIETKVGDKYVTEKLVSLNDPSQDTQLVGLGGEQAGHIIILDHNHVTGDGLRTALFMAKAWVEAGKPPFSQFSGMIEKYPQVIASAQVKSKPYLNKIDELTSVKQDIVLRMPGLQRLDLRYSGTEPLFRAMLETDRQNSERELADAAVSICKIVQNASGNPDGFLEVLNVSHGGLLYEASTYH